MKGLEAITEAILRYTDRQYTIPGFPVTDLGEKLRAEMVVNEKTAIEYALGDSLMGRRAAVIVKNVGVNACADPLLQATAQGLISGVILVVGDDPDALLSQTAQDSRYYGELGELPVIEPGPESCFSGIEAALQVSEEFSRIALVRITPHLLSADVSSEPVPKVPRKGRLSPRVWTMHGRVTAAEELYRKMFDWSSGSPLNRWAGTTAGVGAAPGDTRVVTVNPPPRQIADLVTVNELGRPYVRDHRGTPPPVPQKRPEAMEDRGFYRTFCHNCPFRTLFAILKEKNLQPVCDAGCSVLAMNPPYANGIASYGMGTSVAVAARSTGVALLGDYAMLHSGINALVDVYAKRLPLLCIVMNNNCTAMTGKQPSINPVSHLAWADPVVCRAEDENRLREVIRNVDRPVTVIVEGECPEGANHETVEC